MFLKSGLVRCFLLVILSMTSGCVMMKPFTETAVSSDEELQQVWQRHQARVRELSIWSIEGRAGVKAPEQSGTVNLLWEQSPMTFSIYMTGPFGQTIARMQGVDAGDSDGRYSVVLQIPDREPLTSDSAEQLLHEQTGWFLPFQALQDWVRGVPMKGVDFLYTINDDGLLAKLEQDGWTVEYSKYSKIEGVDLPGRIRAQKGNTTVIVSVRQWKVTN